MFRKFLPNSYESESFLITDSPPIINSSLPNEISTAGFNTAEHPTVLFSMAKNSLSLIHTQKLMSSLCCYYLENFEESQKWKLVSNNDSNLSSSASLSSSSNNISPFSPSSCTSLSENILENNSSTSTLLFPIDSFNKTFSNSKNSDASVIYFSTLPKLTDEYPCESVNKSSIFEIELDNGINPNNKTIISNSFAIKMPEFPELVSKCKRKLQLDFDFNRFFPTNADVELFQVARHKSKSQRAEFDSISRISIESSISDNIDDFYFSSNKQNLNIQFIRQKLPYFFDQKESSTRDSLRSILLGDVFMDVWYNSPFPSEYVPLPRSTIWICPWCLKYTSPSITAQRHKLKCHLNRPPGREIHRQISQTNDKKVLCVFELDGSKHKLYCQNLCLLSKCFLDHKILYYDVNSFLFYVLGEVDQTIDTKSSKSFKNMRIVGYFSKERNIDVHNNVSCIVVFPAYQGLGYGQYLIDFSYLLSRKEGLIGGPETPLSDLGFLSYSKYWMEVIILELNRFLLATNEELPTWNARSTGIYANHILSTLEWMGCLIKNRDGYISINMNRILQYPNALNRKNRPREQFLKKNFNMIKKTSNKNVTCGI